MKRRMFFLLTAVRRLDPIIRNTISRRIPVPLLTILTEGSGTLTINGCSRSIQTMQPLLLLPEEKVSIDSEGLFSGYLLVLEPVSLIKAGQRWQTTDKHIWPEPLRGSDIRLRNTSQVREWLVQMHNESRRPRLQRDDEYLQRLFRELYDTMLQDASEQWQVGDDDNLQRSIRYMHYHLHESITLPQLADIANLTPTSYSRKFKKTMGVSPIEYLTRSRVDEAKKRLTEEESSIKEISIQLGFNSEFYFSRVFKHTIGIAPQLYRRRATLRVAVTACSDFASILRSLGVQPVAVFNCFHYPDTAPESHSRAVAAQLRALRHLQPEIILIDRYHQNCESLLQQVAPTVCIEHQSDWRLAVRKIAELVGRERLAGQQLQRLARRSEDARKRLRSSFSGASLTMLRITDRAIRIQGLPSHPINELLYDELDLTPGSAIEALDRKIEMSPEQLDRLELHTDYLFVQRLHRHPESQRILQQLQSSPFWQNHKAVQGRCARFIPNWYAMSWTPGGRDTIIDSLLHLHETKPIQP
ncbi:AraC family transcriptional regulator [Paenibacillus sp. HB172176]|uniref:AraC family transcriptional regulator n=1 Tax=Paenibacillus sp. HB172176 TaxID=2493690 RepID=UPI00143C30FD|nr:AraC family transcriptional regulator [Paenibacillus sp. HB172176]